eukprot:5282853-Prymnesium_polylepis.1
MLARRPPRTTTTTPRPGCRARRPHPRPHPRGIRPSRTGLSGVGAGRCPAHVHYIRFSRCAAPLVPQQLSTARAENSTPNISPPSARSRRTAHRGQGWTTRPIVRARRGAAFRE